jgi:hypothetical protein
MFALTMYPGSADRAIAGRISTILQETGAPQQAHASPCAQRSLPRPWRTRRPNCRNLALIVRGGDVTRNVISTY